MWTKHAYKMKKVVEKMLLDRKRRLNWDIEKSLLYQSKDIELGVLRELESCNNSAFLGNDIKIKEWEMILRHKGV